jgi:hypothetical protein
VESQLAILRRITGLLVIVGAAMLAFSEQTPVASITSVCNANLTPSSVLSGCVTGQGSPTTVSYNWANLAARTNFFAAGPTVIFAVAAFAAIMWIVFIRRSSVARWFMVTTALFIMAAVLLAFKINVGYLDGFPNIVRNSICNSGSTCVVAHERGLQFTDASVIILLASIFLAVVTQINVDRQRDREISEMTSSLQSQYANNRGF